MLTKIPLSITNHLPPLVLDYIQAEKKARAFYNLPPTIDSFATTIENRKNVNRDVLVKELLIQNKDTSKSALKNIELLSDSKTFTVTTGHQICLFTGPLFFIYKIVTAINLAKDLKKKHPEYNFVPVYWMATEDHDFEEINHINLFGNKHTWETPQKGAVGRFKLDDINPFIEEIKSKFSTPSDVLEKLSSYYLNSGNLAETTRKVVNEIFKDYGLVIIDADNKHLKQLATPIFKDELLNQASLKTISETNSKFKKQGYKTQINARQINLFYLKGDLRERIEYTDNSYKVLNTDLVFTEDGILEELNNYPERFSPNVALRPIYQELILPNLANIGGPGETAYWLQLKSTFEHFNVNYPLLILRNSALLVKKSIFKKIDKLNLSLEDVFTDTDELIKQHISEISDVSFEDEIKELEKVFDLAKNKATRIDFSLEKTVIAELKKAQNAINMIQSKTLKAEKRNNEVAVNQIKSIKNTLFPNNSPQERVENILGHLNEELIEHLIENITPLDYNLIVL